jgi:nucleoid DNA-binding protein
MNRSDFAELVRSNLEFDVPMKYVKEVIEAVWNSIGQELSKEEKLLLPIGTFEAVRTKLRKGINPKTGQEIDILPRTRIKFRASKALKGSV